jgi:hypothetical protein
MVRHQSGKLPAVNPILLLERNQQFPREIKFDIVTRGSRHCFRKIIEARAPVLNAVGLSEPLNKLADISGWQLVDICWQPGRCARSRSFVLTDISHRDVVPPELARNPVHAGVNQANETTVFLLNCHIEHLDAQLPECLTQQYLITNGRSRVAFQIQTSLGINARSKSHDASVGNEMLKRSAQV